LVRLRGKGGGLPLPPPPAPLTARLLVVAVMPNGRRLSAVRRVRVSR
jgi:hypothetical protein